MSQTFIFFGICLNKPTGPTVSDDEMTLAKLTKNVKDLRYLIDRKQFTKKLQKALNYAVDYRYFLRGSIPVWLTSCLTGLDSAALRMLNNNRFTCSAKSKPVKQEVCSNSQTQ